MPRAGHDSPDIHHTVFSVLVVPLRNLLSWKYTTVYQRASSVVFFNLQLMGSHLFLLSAHHSTQYS